MSTADKVAFLLSQKPQNLDVKHSRTHAETYFSKELIRLFAMAVFPYIFGNCNTLDMSICNMQGTLITLQTNIRLRFTIIIFIFTAP